MPKAPVFQSGLLSKMSTSHTLSWSTESHERITEYRLTYRKIMVRAKCVKCQVSKCQKCQVSCVKFHVSSVKCQVCMSDNTNIFVLLVVLLNSFLEFYHCQYKVCTTYLLRRIQVKILIYIIWIICLVTCHNFRT